MEMKKSQFSSLHRSDLTPSFLLCSSFKEGEKNLKNVVQRAFLCRKRKSLFDMDETESLATNFSPIWTK